MVSDALSRQFETDNSEAVCAMITKVQPSWVNDITSSYTDDKEITDMIAQVLLNTSTHPEYTYVEGVLRYHNRIVVGKSHEIRVKVMKVIHDSAFGGHSGIHGSYLRGKSLFYWRGMKKDFHHYVLSCDMCKQCKDESVSYPVLLQPLAVPTSPWSQISMDFIEGCQNLKAKL